MTVYGSCEGVQCRFTIFWIVIIGIFVWMCYLYATLSPLPIEIAERIFR